jgi:hypothetical protein
MSTADVVAVAAAAFLMLGLVAAITLTRRSVRALAASLEESRAETARLASLLEGMNGHDDPEPETPDQVSEPAPAYLSLSKPVIKVRALGAGTSHIARRFRQSRTARGA